MGVFEEYRTLYDEHIVEDAKLLIVRYSTLKHNYEYRPYSHNSSNDALDALSNLIIDNMVPVFHDFKDELIDNKGFHGRTDIRTIDNVRFQRMLKSNLLLMLYNFVEACVVSGMMEIYEHLKNNQNSYSDLIEEIRVIWSNYEIGKTYSIQAGKSAYENAYKPLLNKL